MHYDDTIRRYNFLAGLGAGALLGLGIALLAAPQKGVLRRRLQAVGRGREPSPLQRATRGLARVRK